mmetsp:Transcript_26595/g.54931  ORF Transcript_26595/g.54931 Transcript_26595/m.54931 type:complete len:315 (+) Transcript_26595:1769-2713(+)
MNARTSEGKAGGHAREKTSAICPREEGETLSSSSSLLSPPPLAAPPVVVLFLPEVRRPRGLFWERTLSSSSGAGIGVVAFDGLLREPGSSSLVAAAVVVFVGDSGIRSCGRCTTSSLFLSRSSRRAVVLSTRNPFSSTTYLLLSMFMSPLLLLPGLCSRAVPCFVPGDTSRAAFIGTAPPHEPPPSRPPSELSSFRCDDPKEEEDLVCRKTGRFRTASSSVSKRKLHRLGRGDLVVTQEVFFGLEASTFVSSSEDRFLGGVMDRCRDELPISYSSSPSSPLAAAMVFSTARPRDEWPLSFGAHRFRVVRFRAGR